MLLGKELSKDEKIIVVVRKHWLVFALQAFMLVLLALLPLIVGFIVPNGSLEAIQRSGITPEFLFFLYALYVLQVWTMIFVVWTTYFLDTWIVTNRRVINIDQQTLFYRNMTTLMIEKIQDITVEVRGILPTLFGFGKLILRTAGENDDISIEFAAHPQYVKERIIEAQEGARLEGATDSISSI